MTLHIEGKSLIKISIGHEYVSVYKLIVTLKSFYQFIFCPTSETTLNSALDWFAVCFTFHKAWFHLCGWSPCFLRSLRLPLIWPGWRKLMLKPMVIVKLTNFYHPLFVSVFACCRFSADGYPCRLYGFWQIASKFRKMRNFPQLLTDMHSGVFDSDNAQCLHQMRNGWQSLMFTNL